MESETRTTGPEQQTGQVAKEQASQTAGQARSAASDVMETARGQARTVAEESRSQARAAASTMGNRIADEAEEQTRRASANLRQWSEDLSSMAENAESDSPARSMVRQVAERGHGAADYLEDRGVQGLLDEAQMFARRRPGLFLAGAAIAGFAIGRLVKSAQEAQKQPEPDQGPGQAPAEAPQGQISPDVPPQYREVR